MLEAYTVPLSPRGIANLATKPPWHYAGTIVAAEFCTDPVAGGATLPGLTPHPDGNGHETAMFIDWQFNGSRDEYLDPLRSQYHEFFVLLDARWQDTPVSWCPYIYVDNDHAMARGWIQGFPKKLGTVAQTRTFAGPNQAAPSWPQAGSSTPPLPPLVTGWPMRRSLGEAPPGTPAPDHAPLARRLIFSRVFVMAATGRRRPR